MEAGKRNQPRGSSEEWAAKRLPNAGRQRDGQEDAAKHMQPRGSHQEEADKISQPSGGGHEETCTRRQARGGGEVEAGTMWQARGDGLEVAT